MPDRTLMIDGVAVPRFIYGTAWKEAETARLTGLALGQGFCGIDTANQRQHYDEAAVGAGIAKAIADGLVVRDDLFLQTKFTYRAGQDHRLPYDPAASLATQVSQSFASSLAHLGTDVIDAYLLHGPAQRYDLAPGDWQVWRAMEAIHDSGGARLLGVSNVTYEQLQSLCEGARVPPRIVQNRCYAVRGWDRHVREFCVANAIAYQGFSLLTANREVMGHAKLAQIAERHGRGRAQIVFGFALGAGIVPLTGTSDAAHMRADLEAFEFDLAPEEAATIETLAMP